MEDGKNDALFVTATQLTTTVEEHVVEQQTVAFQGDLLTVVFTDRRSFCVSIPSVCIALGLNVKGQIQRAKRTPMLVEGMRLLSLETRGGTQGTYCMHSEWIDYWLGSVRLKGLQVA
ncbi:MAG TPA: hypothetical protein VKR06_02390, partial [Ktedonosporobacter sp.]|nr:hypothetical protein [Ktedonosporobacter sp.]